jgi:uncharacterized membrane protein YeaQ/YmgE (transglycosylase-associated protein family)
MNLALTGLLFTLMIPATALAQAAAPTTGAAVQDAKEGARESGAVAAETARDAGAAAGEAARDAGAAASEAAAKTAAAAHAAADSAEHAAERGGSILLGVLTWLVFGVVIGAIAKLLMPGRDGGGLLVTSLLGIAGAFVGGLVAAALGLTSLHEFTLAGLVVPVAGAMLLLLAYRMLRAA